MARPPLLSQEGNTRFLTLQTAMLKNIFYACIAAALVFEAAAQDPGPAATKAAQANAYHLQRRLDEASVQYGELLNLEPATTPSADQRAAILRFAPRVFQVSGDPFGLKDVAAIHHPTAPMIAYHFFWEDDIDFPEDNDPCDHELVWVRYDPNSMKVVSFHTYFHERILSSPDAIADAARNEQRPRVNVQWGKHGSLPHGWEKLSIRPDAGDIERNYLELDKLVSLADYNMAAYRKLHTEGRRLPDHPLGRNWPRRFEGDWSDFVAFNKAIDIRPILKKKDFMAVSRWNNAVINQRFIPYNFRPKTEWPDQTTTTAENAGVRPRPGIIAHRGVVLAAPENTVPAIEQAIALGSRAAEIDLRYTADGEVVLLHDETLDRTTNGRGRIAEKTLAEVKKLDAGSWFDSKFSGTHVPTFREVIEMARGRIELYLDLKEADPTPVLRMVARENASGFVYFRPYSYTALRTIVAADRNNKVLFDLDDWMQMPELLRTVRVNFPNVFFSGSLHVWTPEMLTQARQLGVQTFVNVLGPEDNRENLERAVRMGFDFIQTDHEAELRDLLKQ
jgi:glycerophosphoryl diester phosphodiesterase